MARKDSTAVEEQQTPAQQPAQPARTGPRLGDLLIARDLVNPSQLAEALLQQSASGKRLGSLLVELGALEERDLAKVLADQFNLKVVDLRKVTPEVEAIAKISEPVARKLNAIPLRIAGDKLEIAVDDPSNADMLAELSNASRMHLVALVAPATDIKRAINQSYRALSAVERHIKLFEATEVQRRGAEANLQAAVTEEAPVVQVVNLLVQQGLRDRASDIHIEPQDDRVRVRFRIDGALHDMVALPASMSSAVISRIKVMANMNIVERQRPQDGQIQMPLDGRDIDIRVATAPTIWGEKAVLRILDKGRSLLRLGELGMPEDTHRQFSKLIHSPFGMVICAGPTGSGKTTTLYAALQEINSSERNIMTVEDPVEYIFPSINQIQIKEQVGVTFAGGLKSILRQDPDIILVGETRDVETARIVVQSALTGHFVLSSLHATDAPGALFRFLDMGIESFLIASSLLAIVGQRLMRRICEYCKVRYTPSQEEMYFYVESGGTPKTSFYRGEGCNFCATTGYLDRIGVYELLDATEGVKEMIVRGASHDEIRAHAVANGMRTMRQEAIALVEQDVTTVSEVLRAIYVM